MSEPIPLPSPDSILASAVRYLVDGHEHDVASMLLACELCLDGQYINGVNQVARMTLRGPREIVDFLNFEVPEALLAGPVPEALKETVDEAGRSFMARQAIENSISVVLPGTVGLELVCRAQLVELSAEWRNELADIARGKSVHNQACGDRVIDWMQLRFRSHAEVRIAQALERQKVLFFPNCRARIGISTRVNREPDFLICHEGRWGILEVDGPHHQRAADDHDRDRLFKAHGIVHIEHFDAGECFENADAVVKKFLYLLKTAKS